MKGMTSWTLPHLVLLVVVDCASLPPELGSPPAPEPSPTETRPVGAIPSPSPRIIDTVPPASSALTATHYLIDHVGDEYFREHYKLVHEEPVAADLVKASYLYTHEPYVRDLAFTLFFDSQKPGLSDKEVSVVLLQPQAFLIGPAEAEVIALEHGLDPTGGSCQENLVLEPATRNRFAGEVVNADASRTAEAPAPSFRVVLDVEGGEVSAKEVIKPMESHGSQP